MARRKEKKQIVPTLINIGGEGKVEDNRLFAPFGKREKKKQANKG